MDMQHTKARIAKLALHENVSSNPGHGWGGFETYPGNTRHKMSIHLGWEGKLIFSYTFTYLRATHPLSSMFLKMEGNQRSWMKSTWIWGEHAEKLLTVSNIKLRKTLGSCEVATLHVLPLCCPIFSFFPLSYSSQQNRFYWHNSYRHRGEGDVFTLLHHLVPILELYSYSYFYGRQSQFS